MNAVRKKVVDGMKPYLDFAKHKDLIAVTIGADYYSYDFMADEELEADFCEAIVIIEKDYLFMIMARDGIEDSLEYLQDEYTWDDSFAWFENAKSDGKVVAIEFC